MPADPHDLAILADVPGFSRGRQVKAQPEGPVCECCDTQLSRYNPTPWCSVHESEARYLRNLYGGLSPYGARVLAVDELDSDQPRFRCEGCDNPYPIDHQWLTADQRFCPWCKPVHAKRSAALELAS